MNSTAAPDGGPAAVFVLEPANAVEYLRRRRVIDPSIDYRAVELPGGVSGRVVLVRADADSAEADSTGPPAYVAKQALGQLRTDIEWFATPQRAVTEAAALRLCRQLTPEHTPRLVDLDEAGTTLTMTAAPPSWQNWKSLLLHEEQTSSEIVGTAGTLGTVLGRWHEQTWADAELASRFADYHAFAQLRIDPFHRAVRDRDRRLTAAIDVCIDDLLTDRDCLVHGDFSPKNVLVGAAGLWVLDFEVAHVGSAVFDVALLTAHLMLKALHRPQSAATFRDAARAFGVSYRAELSRPPSWDRLGWHTACLLLARVHGTSPVDYLSPAARERCGVIAGATLSQDDCGVEQLWDRIIGTSSAADAGTSAAPAGFAAGAER